MQDVHEFEFDPNFRVITPPFPLREMPAHVINDLSTEQRYSYRVARMISTGIVDWDLIYLKIGKYYGARWLTAANRFARVYISKHGLTGDELKNLRAINEFNIWMYFPMWFEIKCDSSILAGPYHKLREVQIIQKMKRKKDAKSKQVREIAEHFVEKGAWHAHSEHILLSLLASEEEADRQFAIDKIVSIRNGADKGDTSVRPFFPPKLNWNAQSIRELQDWTDAYEPSITASIPTSELPTFLSVPLKIPKIASHTQSCERAVKEVTCASAKVFGAERRDGFIRAKMESRELMPSMDTKANLASLIPS